MPITLESAQRQLDLYLQAEADLLTYGQITEQDGRKRTRADLPEIRKGIDYWQRKVNGIAAGGSGGPRISGLRVG